MWCGCARKSGGCLCVRDAREKGFTLPRTHKMYVHLCMRTTHRSAIQRLFSSHYVCSILERYNIIYSMGSRKGHGPTRFCLSFRSQVGSGWYNVIIIIYLPLYVYIYYAWLIVRHPRRDILIRRTIEPLAETSVMCRTSGCGEGRDLKLYNWRDLRIINTFAVRRALV